MVTVGADDRIYPVGASAAIVESLAREGITESQALQGVHLPTRALRSPDTRVSLHQVLQVCRNAAELSRDPHFAFHAGQRFHVSTYGMYGFAILSSTSHRQAIDFALRYQRLAQPVVKFSFCQEHRRAIWRLVPAAHLAIDSELFQFLIELHLSIVISLHRDVMGASFVPLEIDLQFGPPRDAEIYDSMFGCTVLFDQKENRLVFDAAWLDREANFGNVVAHLETVKLCDALVDQQHLRAGLAGKVREVLLLSHFAPTSCAAVAKQLHMTERTLRRKLLEERTSFRKLVFELRMHMALRYLRDTDLAVQEIAHSVGFSGDASFRHAFHRWTKTAPQQFRRRLRNRLARRARKS